MPPLRPIKIYITLSRGNRVTQLTISWYDGTGPCSPRHREKNSFRVAAFEVLPRNWIVSRFIPACFLFFFPFPSPPLLPFSFFLPSFFFLIFLFFFFHSFFFPEWNRPKGRRGGEELVFGEPSLRYCASSFDTFLKRFTSPRISNGSVLEKSVCYDFKGKGLGETMPRTRPRAFFPPLFNRRREGRGEYFPYCISRYGNFKLEKLAREIWKKKNNRDRPTVE